MIDWLALWGVTQAVGFVFKPILENLAKDAAKDYVKDFFKSCLLSVFPYPTRKSEEQPEALQIATGQAVTEFLKLIQQELEDADLDNTQILQYNLSVEEFIKDPEVAEALGQTFVDKSSLNAKLLKSRWEQLEFKKTLPEDFDWERVAKRYPKKVKAIIQENPELREIFNSENLQKLADAVPVQPEFDLIKHQEGIRERYGNLNLESIDTTGYAYNALKLWQIFIPQNVRECQEYLPQVYEIPKEYFRQLKERGELDEDISPEDLEQRRSLYSQQQIQSVLDIVEVERSRNFNYLVILGDPGSGKSTLLQRLAVKWAELSPKDLPNYPIPLLIELRTYNREKQQKQCKDFLEFFHHGNVICHLPQQELHSRLQQGEVLVMFDGLDEVFDPAQREEVITDIHRFTNDYPNIKAIVTSRVIGYKAQRLRDAEFRHFMLQDLEAEQIEEFIQRWHNLTYNNEAEKIWKRDRLKQAISNSSAIQELAGNPLLLTMMAILNRNQELPRDRAELYNQASRVLLHQWDIERALRDEKIDPITIDYKDKQEMLRRVAFFMQGNEQGLAGNLMNREDLERILTKYLRDIVSDARTIARALIEQLRSRNFILCYVGSDFYAFVHRTFLEYFCAWEFVWKFEKERSLSEDELVQVYAEHWREEAWHEVLRLMAGMLDAKFIGKVLEDLMAQEGEADKFMNLFLAAECLAEVRTRHPVAKIADELFQRIESLTRYDLHYYYDENDEEETKLVRDIRTKAVKTVANTWEERPETLTWLKTRATTDENWNVRRTAVQELARGFRDHPETLTWLKTRATTDQNASIRSTAVRELARGFKDDPETLPWLKSRAITYENWLVRLAAVQELARGFKDDPETLTILKSRATTDEDSNVLGAAVWGLARSFRDHPETLPWLKSRATTDQNWDVRGAAVRELARGFKDDPETLTILKTHATTDESEIVRRTAVRELARGFKDDPETLTILKTRATTDQNWDVRRAAVQELARGFKEDSETLTILKTLATTDENADVRYTAVVKLARGFKDHPETLTILKTRATTDQNWDVRRAAVQELARGFKDDPETLTILKTRATTDQNWDVRRAAVQELARGFKDDPELFELLCDRAVSDPFERRQDNVFEDNPRRAALAGLLRNYLNHPQTLPLLRDRAENDPDEQLREWAKKQLEKFDKD